MQWCDCCGDNCTVTFPLEIKFHDGIVAKKNICIECLDSEEFTINLRRTHLVGNILKRLTNLGK